MHFHEKLLEWSRTGPKFSNGFLSIVRKSNHRTTTPCARIEIVYSMTLLTEQSRCTDLPRETHREDRFIATSHHITTSPHFFADWVQYNASQEHLHRFSLPTCIIAQNMAEHSKLFPPPPLALTQLVCAERVQNLYSQLTTLSGGVFVSEDNGARWVGWMMSVSFWLSCL